jgi:hypothetical protein
MNVPRYLAAGLKITDTLDSGVVYLAKVEKPHTKEHEPFLAQVESDLVVLKLIYPGFGMERYGRDVHEFLSDENMAPKLYDIKTPIPKRFLGRTTLEKYVYMEYLAPPSDTSPKGWISLHDLGVNHVEVALANKNTIIQAVRHITHTLRKAKYVHGDFRTNNLLIYVDISSSSCTLIPRTDTGLPFIKVIDFDWSGHPSTVEQPNTIRYPPHRNPQVRWPGNDGWHIGAGDDDLMIDYWRQEWPRRLRLDEDGEQVENTLK